MGFNSGFKGLKYYCGIFAKNEKSYYKFYVQQPLPNTNQTGCCLYTPVSNNIPYTEKLTVPYTVKYRVIKKSLCI